MYISDLLVFAEVSMNTMLPFPEFSLAEECASTCVSKSRLTVKGCMYSLSLSLICPLALQYLSSTRIMFFLIFSL